jgi:hypothetical protein
MAIIKSGVVNHTLTPEDMSSGLYPGYISLVPAEGPGTLAIPSSCVMVVYTAGTVAFGGTPDFLIGTPVSLALLFNRVFALDALTSQISVRSLALSPGTLTDLVNQPLVVSVDDATLSYGPIVTTVLGSGGTDYAADDTFTLTAGSADATGTVLTVSNTGVVRTYSMDTLGTAYPTGVSNTNTDSEAGSGLTIDVTSVTTGNGNIFINFTYDVIAVPQFAGVSPNWPLR